MLDNGLAHDTAALFKVRPGQIVGEGLVLLLRLHAHVHLIKAVGALLFPIDF